MCAGPSHCNNFSRLTNLDLMQIRTISDTVAGCLLGISVCSLLNILVVRTSSLLLSHLSTTPFSVYRKGFSAELSGITKMAAHTLTSPGMVVPLAASR